MILQLIYLYLMILLVACIDYEHIIDGDYIEDHKSRWLLRGLIIFLIAKNNDILITILNMLSLIALFSASFDIILNKMRKLTWNYHGTVADWDIFWNRHKQLYFCFVLFINILAILSLIFQNQIIIIINNLI